MTDTTNNKDEFDVNKGYYRLLTCIGRRIVEDIEDKDITLQLDEAMKDIKEYPNSRRLYEKLYRIVESNVGRFRNKINCKMGLLSRAVSGRISREYELSVGRQYTIIGVYDHVVIDTLNIVGNPELRIQITKAQPFLWRDSTMVTIRELTEDGEIKDKPQRYLFE